LPQEEEEEARQRRELLTEQKSKIELLPQPIAELVFSFVASGSKEDRLHTMLVQKNWLWLARKTFYPTKTLSYASVNGHLEIIREFLKDSRVDPSADNNQAIRFASRNGRLEVVRELLKDSRVDPSANYNYAIRCTSKNGYLGVVRELLKDSRADPSTYSNWAI